jgi:NAD(P)-dependent dehydrogenase (short-subunit alcohol dehydrogenase family)
MARLNGKVAMITGCGGEHGIGRGIVRRLAADGADLGLTDITHRGTRIVSSKPETAWGGLESVADEVYAVGQRAITALLDIPSAAQIEHVIAKTLEAFGRLDILVSEEAWDAVLDSNRAWQSWLPSLPRMRRSTSPARPSTPPAHPSGIEPGDFTAKIAKIAKTCQLTSI